MHRLLSNVKNAIWHAFHALQQEKSGFVNKSKLKVLTANIGTVLDLYGVEKGLDHYGSTFSLNFENFQTYLLTEVFPSIPNSLTIKEIKLYEKQIEEICWLICRKSYMNQKNLTDKNMYKLFRIFCLLSDFLEDVVLINSLEAVLVIQQIMSALGLDFDNDKRVNYLHRNDIYFRFDQFLELINFKNEINTSEYNESFNEVIDDMCETYIEDVIKKGYLSKRGYVLPTHREYWFILQPYEITYYKKQYEKEICGTINLDAICTVKPITGSNHKSLKFIVSSGDRYYEFATYDHKTRMQWIAAIQLAITYSAGQIGYQRDLITRRKKKRSEELLRIKNDEKLKTIYLKDAENAKQQLEEEKLARLAAEMEAKELSKLAKQDSQRLAELETTKTNLEQLLKDEEIVRGLQARVLSEEWKKRDELEQLQNEQKLILEQFEIKHKENEIQLRVAEEKLKKLETERRNLDVELKTARFKIIQFEENKDDLESRIYATRQIPSGSGVRRTFSFVLPSRERSTDLEISN